MVCGFYGQPVIDKGEYSSSVTGEISMKLGINSQHVSGHC